LSSFPQYLDIVVQCTRKTEVRSWRTLFTYLPPPQELFEESLQRGTLKTAGGYLLILHTFEELSSSSEQLVRLLSRAKDEGDWELCKELARFLTALDESGATLMEALEMVNLRSPKDERGSSSFLFEGTRLKVPRPARGSSRSLNGATNSDDERSSSDSRSPRDKKADPADYFTSHNDVIRD
jgi:RAB6A-GEF complex partner protein 1